MATAAPTVSPKVNDGAADSSTATVSLFIGNHAPTLTNPGTLDHLRSDVLSLGTQAADADGDSLSYSATGLPTGLSINSSTGVISGTIANTASTSSPYSVTVTVADSYSGSANQTFDWAIHYQISATGSVLVGLEQQSTSGVIATFTTDDTGAAYQDFTATILWGDGTSSAGTVSANGGAFDINADHDYTRRGSYAAVVQIENTLHGGVNVAPVYVVVLPVEDHASVQTILDSDVTSSGAVSASATKGSGVYGITGTGSYAYTLTVSFVDGLHSAVEATYIGDIDFTLSQSGEATSTSFTLGSYALTETGTADIERLIETSDLGGSFTRTEIGVLTIDDWSKTGNDALETYTVSAELSVSLTAEEDGVYGGLSYHREEAWTVGTLFGEVGDFADEYTETREVSSSASWTETGTVWTYEYENESSDRVHEFTAVDSGEFSSGDYTVIIDGTSDSGTTGSFTNGVATGSTTAGGDPVTFAFTKTANWSTGDYTLSQVITADNATGFEDFDNQTASGEQDWTGNTTVTIDQTGNTLTGDYVLSVETDVTRRGHGQQRKSGRNQRLHVLRRKHDDVRSGGQRPHRRLHARSWIVLEQRIDFGRRKPNCGRQQLRLRFRHI